MPFKTDTLFYKCWTNKKKQTGCNWLDTTEKPPTYLILSVYNKSQTWHRIGLLYSVSAVFVYVCVAGQMPMSCKCMYDWPRVENHVKAGWKSLESHEALAQRSIPLTHTHTYTQTAHVKRCANIHAPADILYSHAHTSTTRGKHAHEKIKIKRCSASIHKCIRTPCLWSHPHISTHAQPELQSPTLPLPHVCSTALLSVHWSLRRGGLIRPAPLHRHTHAQRRTIHGDMHTNNAKSTHAQ